SPRPLRLRSRHARCRPAPDTVGQALAADGENVRTTLEAVSPRHFDGAVTLLSDRNRRVFVLAGEIALGAGVALVTQLDLLRDGIVALGGSPVRVARQLAELEAGDVVVVI